MKTISLSQGYVTLVDDDKFEELNQYKWYYKDGYAIRKVSPLSSTIYMHHVVFGQVTYLDHHDRNTLNNQRYNLLPCTHGANIQNAKIRSTNKTGFRGVFVLGSTRKWVARITYNGKQRQIGSFNSAEEAARAYDKRALELFGITAALNFPEENPALKIANDVPDIFGKFKELNAGSI